jgi:G3E family GTPase
MLQLLHWKGPAGLEVHHQAPSGLVGRGEPADDARGGRRFDLGRAAQSAGWQRELLGGGVHAPEAEALGITSFVFRAPRPFHPLRLWRAVLEDAALPPVLRAKVRVG